MIHTKKLPRRLKEIKERMHVLSCPRLSGKVSAELTNGASVQARKSDSTCVHLLFQEHLTLRKKEFIFPLLPAVKVHTKTPPFFESGVIFYAMSRFFRILFSTPWNIFMSVSETPA